jgi:hypothetical protein
VDLEPATRDPDTVKYTPGHSTSTVLEAWMNEEADHYSSSSQCIANKLPIFPSPTFFMNECTFFREGDGFIESNISHFVDTYCAIFKAKDLAIGHGYRMGMSGFDETSPPTYPYLKAVSAHSAAVQLYARSGQLATVDLLPQEERPKIMPVHSAALPQAIRITYFKLFSAHSTRNGGIKPDLNRS